MGSSQLRRPPGIVALSNARNSGAADGWPVQPLPNQTQPDPTRRLFLVHFSWSPSCACACQCLHTSRRTRRRRLSPHFACCLTPSDIERKESAHKQTPASPPEVPLYGTSHVPLRPNILIPRGPWLPNLFPCPHPQDSRPHAPQLCPTLA